MLRPLSAIATCLFCFKVKDIRVVSNHNIELTEDEAIVLFEFFSRYEDTNKLSIAHASEHLVLMKLSSQIDKTTAAMFDSNYQNMLDIARMRIAKNFDGDIPDFEKVF